jgi:CcmD family protein
MRALQPILRAAGIAVLSAVSAGASVLLAQGPAQEAQETFRPVSPDELALERLPATPFVFWAYAIVWLVLIGYVFFLWRRVGRVEQELAALTVRLDERRR